MSRRVVVGGQAPVLGTDGFWVTPAKPESVEVTLLCRKTQPYDHHDARPIKVEILKATQNEDEITNWLGQNQGYTGWEYFTQVLEIEEDMLKR